MLCKQASNGTALKESLLGNYYFIGVFFKLNLDSCFMLLFNFIGYRKYSKSAAATGNPL
jgi:hypothetical protein